jgi:hypothetical protein
MAKNTPGRKARLVDSIRVKRCGAGAGLRQYGTKVDGKQ